MKFQIKFRDETAPFRIKLNTSENLTVGFKELQRYDGAVTNYEGDYTIVPKPNEAQVLATAGKRMTDNLTVKEIPYYEVSNTVGKTAYIGKEVKIYGN